MGLRDWLKKLTEPQPVSSTSTSANELELLQKHFAFLASDLGYTLAQAETLAEYKGKNLVVYRSDSAEKQIEICGGGSFFHAQIRQLINGQPAPYYQKEHQLHYHTLAALDNPKHDSSIYWPYGPKGLTGAVENTAALFQRHRTLISGNGWVDKEKAHQAKNEHHLHAYGKPHPEMPEPFIYSVKAMVDQQFPELKLAFYNAELPHYHKDSTLQCVIYKGDSKALKIRQYDYRDDNDVYQVYIDDEKVWTVRVKPESREKALEEIKKACEEHLT
ncbi:MAG TPA: hypothetical protein DCP28_36850 [Cytophagales bacterium]|nr:hypothetical protein [Cytophagales bacterium]